MNIYPITSINNSQNKSYTAPSFKKVVPVKILINGHQISDEKTCKAVFKNFYKILRNPQNDIGNSIRTGFLRTVQDYKIHSRADKKIITSTFIDKGLYIFTGKDAEELAKYSDEIGHAQKEGIDKVGTSDTYEANVKKQEYFAFAKKLINSASKLKELKEENGKVFWGDELGLHINVKANGLPTDKGYKLEIISAPFRHIKKEVQPEAKAAQKPAAKPSRRRGKTADWPARAQQQTDMPKGDDYLSFD